MTEKKLLTVGLAHITVAMALFVTLIFLNSCVQERERGPRFKEPCNLSTLDSVLIVIAWAESRSNIMFEDTITTYVDSIRVVQDYGIIISANIDTVDSQIIDSLWQRKQWGLSAYEVIK